MFQPPDPPKYDDTLPNLIWIPCDDDNQLPAVLLQRPDAEYIIIYSHGNAMDIAYVGDIGQIFLEDLKTNFLGFDYTGYGLANKSKSPSEKSATKDMRMVYRFVRDQLKWPADRIILYGQSIGTGVACNGAGYAKEQGENIMALILHSPYLSIRQLAEAIAGSLGKLIANRFNNLDLLENVLDCPLLVVHGDRDEVIPFEMGKTLYERSNSIIKEFSIAEGRRHNNIMVHYSIILPFKNSIMPKIEARTSPIPSSVNLGDFMKVKRGASCSSLRIRSKT